MSASASRAFLASILLASLASPEAFAAEAPAETAPAAVPEDVLTELLPRLAATEARLQALYDASTFVVRSTSTKSDSLGKKKERSEVETRMFVHDGKPWEEIVRYVDDGRDVTESRNEKRQKELASGKRTRKDAMPFSSPFTEARQKRHRFRDLGAVEQSETLRRIAFSPKKGKKGDETSRGEAIVDLARGAIVSMTLEPSDLPPFADEAEIRLEMNNETPAGPALSRVLVEGSGSFLFVRRKLRVDARISGYVVPPAFARSAAP